MKQKHEHLDALEITGNAVLACFGAIASNFMVANRPYAPGRWTARQVLIHITDAEAVFLDRLRRVVSEKNAVLQAFDQDQWMARLGGDWRNLGDVRDQFVVTRLALRDLVRSMEPLDFQMMGTHSEVGLLTAEQIVTKVYEHTAHHLGQVQAALLGTVWQPTPR